MFSVSMRYEDWGDFNNKDQRRPGIRDVMVRTTDGGKTWGNPTIVHQHTSETGFTFDPSNADHILAFTRIQRGLLPGDDPTKNGCSFGWPYKNGLLLESIDGGRTFRFSGPRAMLSSSPGIEDAKRSKNGARGDVAALQSRHRSVSMAVARGSPTTRRGLHT